MKGLKKCLLAGLSLFCGSQAVAAPPVVQRDSAHVSVSYASDVVNGVEYASGVSFNIGGRASFEPKSWLKVVPSLDFSYQSLGALEDNASETVMNLDVSLEGRVRLLSRSAQVYAGIGAEYMLHREFMIHTGDESHRMLNVAGPKLVFALEHPNVDVMVSFSELFGYRDASYERGRTLRYDKVACAVTPRYWRVELPALYEFHHWVLADYNNDYNHLKHVFRVRPGFDIAGGLSAFVDIAYTHSPEGDGNAHVMEIGGGLRLKW